MSETNSDDVFRLSTINRERKVSITACLRDEDNTTVELQEVIDKVMGYMDDKLDREKGGENAIANQILPLMSSLVGYSLPKLAGTDMAAALLCHQGLRHVITVLPMLSFLLLKFIQKHGLKIYTMEEPLDDEKLEQIMRLDGASSAINMAAMMGIDPKELMKEMHRVGQLTQDDIEELTGERPTADGPDKNSN